MKRYYNLKTESPTQNGGVLEVEIASGRVAIRDFIVPDDDESCNIQDNGGGEYLCVVPHGKFCFGGGATAISPAVLPGCYTETKDSVRLEIRKGLLKLLDEKSLEGTPVFLSEINFNKAWGMREEAFYWRMMQWYFVFTP